MKNNVDIVSGLLILKLGTQCSNKLKGSNKLKVTGFRLRSIPEWRRPFYGYRKTVSILFLY